MYKTVLIVCFLIAEIGNAQKVTLEKGIISIDNQVFLKYNDTSKNVSLQTLNGQEFATITAHSFEAGNKKTLQNPNDRVQSASGTVNYYVVSFTDFDLEFETDIELNKLYAAFKKYGLIQQGQVSQKHALQIGAKLSDIISGKRPIIKRKN